MMNPTLMQPLDHYEDWLKLMIRSVELTRNVVPGLVHAPGAPAAMRSAAPVHAVDQGIALMRFVQSWLNLQHTLLGAAMQSAETYRTALLGYQNGNMHDSTDRRAAA
jgi:hypothetical protein